MLQDVFFVILISHDNTSIIIFSPSIYIYFPEPKPNKSSLLYLFHTVVNTSDSQRRGGVEAWCKLMRVRLEGWVRCFLNCNWSGLICGRLTIVWWDASVDGFLLLQHLFSSFFYDGGGWWGRCFGQGLACCREAWWRQIFNFSHMLLHLFDDFSFHARNSDRIYLF